MSTDTCWVSGYGGRGFWDIVGDREPHQVSAPEPAVYLLKTETESSEISQSHALGLCKNHAQNDYNWCSRGVVLSGHIAAYKCFSLSHPIAIAACELAVVAGTLDANLYCDGTKQSEMDMCDKLKP